MLSATCFTEIIFRSINKRRDKVVLGDVVYRKFWDFARGKGGFLLLLSILQYFNISLSVFQYFTYFQYYQYNLMLSWILRRVSLGVYTKHVFQQGDKELKSVLKVLLFSVTR